MLVGKSVKAQLKLSAACCGESSILKEQYRSSFARLPRSKLLGMRSLPNLTDYQLKSMHEPDEPKMRGF
jgi:hypothetical protein